MLSLGIVSLSRKVKTIVLVPFFALLILSACGYFGDLFRPSPGVLPKKPIKPVVEFLEQSIKPDDIIAFTNLSPMPSCQFYSQGKLPYPYFFFDPKFPNTDWQRPFSAGRYFIPVQRIGQLAFSKIWLIASDWKRSGELDENCQSVKEWLDGRFRLESASEFSGLWVFQYGKR